MEYSYQEYYRDFRRWIFQSVESDYKIFRIVENESSKTTFYKSFINKVFQNLEKDDKNLLAPSLATHSPKVERNNLLKR